MAKLLHRFGQFANERNRNEEVSLKSNQIDTWNRIMQTVVRETMKWNLFENFLDIHGSFNIFETRFVNINHSYSPSTVRSHVFPPRTECHAITNYCSRSRFAETLRFKLTSHSQFDRWWSSIEKKCQHPNWLFQSQRELTMEWTKWLKPQLWKFKIRICAVEVRVWPLATVTVKQHWISGTRSQTRFAFIAVDHSFTANNETIRINKLVKFSIRSTNWTTMFRITEISYSITSCSSQ